MRIMTIKSLQSKSSLVIKLIQIGSRKKFKTLYRDLGMSEAMILLETIYSLRANLGLCILPSES